MKLNERRNTNTTVHNKKFDRRLNIKTFFTMARMTKKIITKDKAVHGDRFDCSKMGYVARVTANLT